MTIRNILSIFDKSEQRSSLLEQLTNNFSKIQLKGTVGSGFSFIVASIFKDNDRSMLLIMEDKEKAAYCFNDLELFFNNTELFYYPASYQIPYEIEKIDNANTLVRLETIDAIYKDNSKKIIVTYPKALSEKIINKQIFERYTIKIKNGDKISIQKLTEQLFDYQFKKVNFITNPGEFSVRGGIIDVFSYTNDLPFRIEFFDEEIESIRTFDITTQLSKSFVNKIDITPNTDLITHNQEKRNFLLELLPKAWFYIHDVDLYLDILDKKYNQARQKYMLQEGEIQKTSYELLYNDSKQQISFLESTSFIFHSSRKLNKNATIIDFKQQPQPVFNKNFELLISNLKENKAEGLQNYIFCASTQQASRLEDIFETIDKEISYKIILNKLFAGFIDKILGVAFYTDHEIFERYNKYKLKEMSLKRNALSLQELSKLSMGDYVSHIDHGIGKFAGLRKIETGKNVQEAIQLVYGDGDILYVNIHSLHKISKYSGKEGSVPKLHKLGSKSWALLKNKAKKRVKEIAFDLINLYAKRKTKKGFQYNPDSYLQHELEASFLYEDTLDQFQVTQDVKKDMESTNPMDRLVCGDVGFGKTEIAIRATFKAVDNGKQVVVLVPTTILAFQHYKTFSKRLKDFPVTVDYINRFRTIKDRNKIIKELYEGKIDIVIGTHQLINNKILYKDLGLLIVDEEQKFGVAIKEKLRTLKENIDVLTLTATPIPRTLQFSLMSARDLSVIKTPPLDRYPIENSFINFNEIAIRDAIIQELQRDGQVFFINNRIENLKEIAGVLQRLVPDARIIIAHGQMDGKKIETLILGFMQGNYDILVSTSIVENGIDVPNANTMFINNAHHFGLSDLHQMRGRVGRSNRKAYCYFISPPKSLLTSEAKQRLQALDEHSSLNSGFNIAMKDLEIRGAGDLLGGEQSGFINNLGFDTYQKILQEAISELKETEFKELYKEEERNFVDDVQISTDWEILIPNNYVDSSAERFSLYQQISKLNTEEELVKLKNNINDRFGKIPIEVENLLHSMKIKWIAKKLSLQKIVVKNNKMKGYFISDQQSDFYNTKVFQNIISKVASSKGEYAIKEKETNNKVCLIIYIKNIENIEVALSKLQNLRPLQ